MRSNHGTFYYNQLAALQILVGDTAGAKQTLEEYFTTQYTWQIVANGDQVRPTWEASTSLVTSFAHYPLHSSAPRDRPHAPIPLSRIQPCCHDRTCTRPATAHPQHANVPSCHAQTNAKLGAYIGYDVWSLKTSKGTTIKDALDYAITMPAGSEAASELWPNVVAVGAIYGDTAGTYAKWMLDNAGNTYPADAQFLWNQPFSDSGLVAAAATSTGSNSSSSGVRQQDGALAPLGASWNVLAMAVGAAVVALFA